jgi:glycosyltransferase involved in cell wall biosynthesis
MFIHLSDSEGGVPLALQEAVSCGIPVLACSTGGVVEIVNQDTGVLVPIEHSQEMFEKAFNEVFMHFSRNEERRSVCRQFWKENFDLSTGVNALKRKFDELNNCNA